MFCVSMRIIRATQLLWVILLILRTTSRQEKDSNKYRIGASFANGHDERVYYQIQWTVPNEDGPSSLLCVHPKKASLKIGTKLILRKCDSEKMVQLWRMDEGGRIRNRKNDSKCIRKRKWKQVRIDACSIMGDGDDISMDWTRTDDHLVWRMKKRRYLALTVIEKGRKRILALRDIDSTNKAQESQFKLVLPSILPPSIPPTSLPTPLVTADDDWTLSTLLQQFKNTMPKRSSENYLPPNATTLMDWYTVIRSMMAGNCDDTISIPSSLGPYRLIPLTEQSQQYCILTSFGDTGHNYHWGIVIIHHSTNTDDDITNLSIDITHPLSDLSTMEQGLELFLDIRAKSFVVAGAHREANSNQSGCDGYPNSDASHSPTHPFVRSVEAIAAHYSNLGQEYMAVQFHGMAESTCPDVGVYISHGSNRVPQVYDGARVLRDALSQAILEEEEEEGGKTMNDWGEITVPGDKPSCILSGTKNVVGRFLNGVEGWCACQVGWDVGVYTGRFLHVEQTRVWREPGMYPIWKIALQTFVEVQGLGNSERRNDRRSRRRVVGDGDGAASSPTTPWVVHHSNAGQRKLMPGYSIEYPNSPNLVLREGETVRIRWRRIHNYDPLQLSIHYDNCWKTSVATIVQATENEDHYDWIVSTPPLYHDGGGFLLRVQSASTPIIEAYSDYGFRWVVA